MSAPTAEVLRVETELAHDLLGQFRDYLAQLAAGPRPVEEFLRLVGTERQLQRLTRHGMVRVADNRVHSGAANFLRHRQENLSEWLQGVLLPSLVAVANSTATESPSKNLRIERRYLNAVLANPKARFEAALLGVGGNQTANDAELRIDVALVGTTIVSPTTGQIGEDLLNDVRHAALELAQGSESARLSLGTLYGGALELESAHDGVDRFLAGLADLTTEPTDAAYVVAMTLRAQPTAAKMQRSGA